MKPTRTTRAMLALLATATLTLVLTACGGGADTSVSGTTWGDTAKTDTPSLAFASDGTLSGTDGCNVIGGDWTESDNTVQFGPLISTRMFCENIDDWLAQSVTAVVDGDKLIFSDKDGEEIGTLEKTKG